jgi:5-methylcytosine-specific restriction endonuclease McrA
VVGEKDMKKHTKVYMSYFGFKIAEDMFCEICGSPAVDLHHIKARGMGGSNTKDHIENLMALCRKCHIDMGDKKSEMEFLKEKHNQFIIKWKNGKV